LHTVNIALPLTRNKYVTYGQTVPLIEKVNGRVDCRRPWQSTWCSTLLEVTAVSRGRVWVAGASLGSLTHWCSNSELATKQKFIQKIAKSFAICKLRSAMGTLTPDLALLSHLQLQLFKSVLLALAHLLLLAFTASVKWSVFASVFHFTTRRF